MNKDIDSQSEILFENIECAFDPLADFGDDEDDASEGQIGPNSQAQLNALRNRHENNKPANERIEDLFETLSTRRRILLGILNFVKDEPKRSDALKAEVDELQKYDSSVYSGYDFSILLQEAGAIERVDEEGNPDDSEFEQQPEIVEIDGVRFYKPTDGKQVFWLITDEGLAYLAKDDPYSKLKERLENDPQYAPIYKRVLIKCAEDGGMKTPQLEAIIDNDPLVQQPRRYCSHFTKGLEDCGGLVWKGAWITTELGLKALEELLSDVEDEVPADDVTSAEGGVQ